MKLLIASRGPLHTIVSIPQVNQKLRYWISYDDLKRSKVPVLNRAPQAHVGIEILDGHPNATVAQFLTG